MDDVRVQQLEQQALELERQLAELRTAIDEVKAEVRPDAEAATEPPHHAPDTAATDVVDRRSLLRRSGAVAAGAIAGGAAIAAGTATPAAAVNGGNMILGEVNAATNLTTLEGRMNVRSTSINTYALRAIAASSGGDAVYALAQGVDGIGVIASSTEGAGLVVSNGTQVIPPQAGNWNYGAFLTVSSHLYFCYVGGFGPNTKWARLSGVFVPFDGSIRVYDSRPATQPIAGLKTKFANHEERTLSLTPNNAVPTSPVPSAVVLNLTATNTNPGGYFTAWRAYTPWPGTSSVSWGSANQTIANQSTVKLGGLPEIKVRCEGAGGADLIVDVVGYYL